MGTTPTEKEGDTLLGGETGRHQALVSQTSHSRAPNELSSAPSLPTYAHLTPLVTQLQNRVCSNCGSGRSFDPAAEAWTRQIWSQPRLMD
jgi:hypothetical protein